MLYKEVKENLNKHASLSLQFVTIALYPLVIKNIFPDLLGLHLWESHVIWNFD